MIFADKLIQLRKKAGWSQEELAEQMNVTRQSVSKWEGAQAIPNLEKIVYLSKLFGVSTDYLLKDELEDTEGSISFDEMSALRRVSMEEADAFLSVKAVTSKSIALAIFLCILSPISLLILGEIGMIISIILVAVAVAVFISSGRKTEAYDYLEKEIFETEYGVSGMVVERRAQYNGIYTRSNVIGVSLCVMALIPLFGEAIFKDATELLITIMLSASLVIAGIGVFFLISSGIIWASYEKLLQEGDYAKEKKKSQFIINAISAAYWLIVTAIYLGYGFSENNWKYGRGIWVVAGLVFLAIDMIAKLLVKRK